MKVLFTLACCFFLINISVGQPVIQSFSPQSGPVGTAVTITGLNFSSTAAGNVVYFGATRAVVSSATATSLNVTVPPGANYRPLSVTVNGLTGYARKPFNITFSAQPSFSNTSFAPRVDRPTGTYPRHANICDFDGDGKADVSVTNHTANTLSIFKNSSTPGVVALNAVLTLPVNSNPFAEHTGDIDGDGKQDIIVNNYNNSTISIFRNTGGSGSISFATPVIIPTALNPYWIDIADVDLDGKPDIFCTNQNNSSISVFRNTSAVGSISFATKIDFALGLRPNGGSFGDLDGDGRPDIAVANMQNNSVSVLRNISSGSSINFATQIDIPAGTAPFNVTISDIDNDGRNELLIPNSASSNISVFKNNSTLGNISFSPAVNFPSGDSPLMISAGDLNGDNTPDLSVVNFASNSISVYKNLSAPGNIQLEPKFDYTTGALPRSVSLGDIDGDGRTDMVAPNCISNTLSVILNLPLLSDCQGFINTFPYDQNFESTDGNWLPGGTAPDWAWGTPAKPVISSAGGGIRSWVTGGLNNSAYNNGENSWLQSPCFDLSSLQYPEITFKVFWETERKFDGASFQYSIDGGTTWLYLGSVNSNTNCQGENWFNTSPITYLANAGGWSGNIQSNSGSCLGGSGSGGWLTAKHTLTALAGQSTVRFRFLFGAGTTCNAYDGFAIDDVHIGEAPPNTASFLFSCTSERDVAFTSTSSCASSYSWSFGDAGSGTNNSSTLANPTHSFSGPGTYTVTLTTNFVTGPAVVNTKQVVILGATNTTNWPGRCNNIPDASLTVNPTGSNSAYFFNWDTSPAQNSQTVTGLGAGSYTVIVNSLNACSISSTFLLAAPTPIVISTNITDVSCVSGKGSITATVTGGTPPYQYTWSNAATTSTAGNLDPGNYSLLVVDANGCSKNSGPLEVRSIPGGLLVDLGPDRNICPGTSVTLTPGTYAGYLWQDNSTGPSYTVNGTGTYYVTVTNTNGCTGSDTVRVKVDCSDIYFPSAFTPDADGRNDGFGPVGNILSLSNYGLYVYNRYGQQVFITNDPLHKWDGTFKGAKPNTGSFVWMAEYILNGQRQSRKGTVTLIR